MGNGDAGADAAGVSSRSSSMASRASQHAASALAGRCGQRHALSEPERCSHVHRLVHVELTVRCARATHRAAADSEQRLQSCNLFTSSAGM